MELMLGAAGILIAWLFAKGCRWSLVLGAVAGSFFGLAGFGGAISGMLPGAAVAGLLALVAKKEAA